MAQAKPVRKVPYDPELEATLAALLLPGGLTREIIPLVRPQLNALNTAESALSKYPDISHEERTISGPHGDIILSIFRPAKKLPDGNPGIYWIHGGGMIMGNRFLGFDSLAVCINEHDVVAVSVEYRTAPEHPDPQPLDDCYAGLEWVGENLELLGINPKKLVIGGQSAGGGLAAGVALLARDRGGPELCAQLLICPMLDDRNRSVSSQQYVDEGSWSGKTNRMAWECLLGDNAGKTSSIYAAPARAEDLSRLPPAFIDVASAEVFRDEDVAYATKLWESGVQAEIHVWPGGFHGFDMLVPSHPLSQLAINTRSAWLGRTLSAV